MFSISFGILSHCIEKIILRQCNEKDQWLYPGHPRKKILGFARILHVGLGRMFSSEES